jgi:hypothetical protein
MIKKRRSIKKSKKRKTNKKYTTKKNKKTYRKKMRGGVFWDEQLSADEQILVDRSNSQPLKINECKQRDKDDKWVNIKYNVDEIPFDSDLAPIKIFKKGSASLADLENGVHNFILFWDETNKEYILTTSFFNAFEFATKHYMISKRLGERVPPKFILSGEIEVTDNMPTKFHDTSSFFFQSIGTNFKKGFLIHYLSAFMKIPENKKLADSDFPTFKEKFWEDVFFNKAEVDKKHEVVWLAPKKIPEISFRKRGDFRWYFDEKVDTMEKLKGHLKSEDDPFNNRYKEFNFVSRGTIEKYIDTITNIMNDAFKTIFSSSAISSAINFEYADARKFNYGNQTNKEMFYEDMCKQTPPYTFDIYDNEDKCLAGTDKIGDVCSELL